MTFKPVPLSIIIPCFNRSNCVARSIKSALDDAPSAEVIVIDDGSTDSSWDAIKSFDQVVARRTENRGVSAARNTGLQLASRQYVRFLDSDDAVIHGSSARLLNRASPRIAPVGRVQSGNYGFPNIEAVTTIPAGALFEQTLPLGLVLLPREELVAAGGFNESLTIGEDQELVVRLAKRGLLFQQGDEVVYIVGDSENNRATRDSSPRLFDALCSTLSVIANHASNDEEKEMLGRQAWRLGREASRRGFRRQALILFEAAYQLAGSNAVHGPWPLRLMYKFIDPFRTERVLTVAKHLAQR